MKKKYFIPKIEIVMIDSTDLIATSPDLGGDYDPGLDNLSRSFYDFEED